ncbi:hypothetical protein ACFQ3N_13050 [Virgibacillus byunsanensis]|uniref:Uncharacterized protein n=1 Tax=Virgibacillus byunsanensis TaxID=570945 RepID=A0ABW3LNC0_9BACI
MKISRFLLINIAIAFVLTFVFTNVVGAKSHGPDVTKQLSEVRQATAKYHDIEAAFKDGYGTDYHLVPNMGIHLTNNDLLKNGSNDPLAPEVLVYEPKENGDYKLVAVEYMSLGEERPSLFNQEFEDGPFPGSFALHAWVWQGNPDGIFASFNPNVENVK